jgi:transposase
MKRGIHSSEVTREPGEYHTSISLLCEVSLRIFFKITTTTQLIKRLKTDSTLRLLCGFDKVSGISTFSCNFTELSETNVMSETLDTLVKEDHEGKVIYHVSPDSTAIEARKTQKEGDSPSKARNGH